MADEKRVEKVIATNRSARHDYHIDETLEVGIVLQGTEVKSLRVGRANLRDSFARVENGEVWLYNMHISPYDFGNRWNHEPKRPRKLLLRREEIRRLIGKGKEKGHTLVPLTAYLGARGHVKLQLAVARGKKLWDKREDVAKRDAEREISRTLRNREKE